MMIFVGSHFILAVFLHVSKGDSQWNETCPESGKSCIRNTTTLYVDSGSDVIVNCFCSNQSYSTVTGPFLPSLTTKGEDCISPYTDGHTLNPELNKTKFMIVGSYNNNECNLKIMHFSREEDGIYRCQYEVMETVYIHEYNVVAKSTPYIGISVKPKKPNLIEGRNGMICCKVESNSPVMLTELKKNNEKLQIKRGNKNCFVFSPFNRNDSGHYTCFTGDKSDRSNSSIDLKILYPPNVTVSYTLETTYIAFTCNAAGEPNNYTFLSWKYVSEHPKHIRFLNGTTHGTLRVKRTNNSVNQYEDSGYYICRVLNGIPDIKGKKIQEGKVFVISEALKRPSESHHEFKPIFPIIAVTIIGLVVVSFVLRRYTNNCTSRQSSSDINGSDEDFQGHSVGNQLYQSAQPVELMDLRGRGQAESRLMEDESESHMPRNNRNLGPDLELSVGLDITQQNRRVLLEGPHAQINESNLNYVDVMFDARPDLREFVIHGQEARTIYSDIDHLSRAVALPSSSESESEDEDVNIEGIQHFSGKRKA